MGDHLCTDYELCPCGSLQCEGCCPPDVHEDNLAEMAAS